MNPVDVLLHAVGRFPLMIVSLTVLGAVVALVIAVSQPNNYESVGMLLVRMGARESQTIESAVDPDLTPRIGSTATGDELIMLMDPSLRERVVAEVGVDRILRPYDPRTDDNPRTPRHIRLLHDFQSWLMSVEDQPTQEPTGPPTPEMIGAAVNVIADGVDISAQRRTNTIVVSFYAHDAELAQLVSTAYLKVFQDRHREFYQTADKFSFVSARLEEANLAAQAARRALLARREKDGIFNLRDLMEALAGENQELEALNRSDSVQLQSLKRQLVVLDKQIEGTPVELQLSSADPVLPSPAEGILATGAPDSEEPLRVYSTASLIAQLVQANDQLIALGNEYAEGSSYYKQESKRLEGRVASLDSQIRQLAAGQRSGADSSLPVLTPTGQRQRNTIYTTLISEQLAISRQYEALTAVRKARETICTANAKQLGSLQALEPVYTELERKVAETEEHAAELGQAHSHSATLELIDSDERMSNLLVTQKPYLPTEKEGPDRLKTLLMGVFGGLALGLGAATARQLLDSRLRYPADAESALGIRVLGIVPEQRNWRRKGRKLQKTMSK